MPAAAVKTKPITRVSQLIPDPKNANLGTERGNAFIERSIREYGLGRSILLDKKGRIIAGNKTVENAGALGIEEVQVIQTDGKRIIAVQRMDLDMAKDPKARELALADNRAAELNLEWAGDVLAEMGQEIDLQPFFSASELAAIVGKHATYEDAPEPQLDKADELQRKWRTKRGQLWEIPSHVAPGAKHRLVCGDSTKKEEVARLWANVPQDAAPVLMVTDPPYGVDYGAIVAGRENQKKGGWTDIKNDALSDDDLLALLTGAFSLCNALVAFVWHPAGARRFLFWKALESNGWRISQEIIWVKNALVFGRADYQWRHEPCLYAKREGAGRQEDRTQTTVWEFNKPHDSVHPTQKPVELFRRSVENHSTAGQGCYDPFGGSGTLLVACEQTGRTGYAVGDRAEVCRGRS